MQRFEGFDNPTTTPVPDQLFDELMPHLVGSELKVLLYIIRRTYGFRKTADRISLSQISKGIRKRDGSILDVGTGLDRRNVQRALTKLEEKNIIIVTRQRAADGVNQINTYALRLRDERVGAKNPHGSGEMSPPVAVWAPPTTNSNNKQLNNTVNGIKNLPKLNHPRAKVELLVQDIIDTLGDPGSAGLYTMVAQRIPEVDIYQALSEIKQDPKVRNRGAVFTTRMMQYATERLKGQIGSASSRGSGT